MSKKGMSLVTKIMLGLILGIIVGLFFVSSPDFPTNYIKPIGTLFLNLIKMTIVPLVFASIVGGAASIGDIKKLGRIGGKTMVYFMATTAFAILIGLILANVFKPGIGITLAHDVEVQKASEAPSLIDTLLNVVPSNPIDALAKGDMLQIIFFALLSGVGAAYIGEQGKAYLKFCESVAEIMYKLTELIMSLAPYGVFALIVPVIAANGPKVLLPLLKLIVVCYMGYVLHAILTYSFSVSLASGISPLKFFKGTLPATAMGFSTCSGAGTLPFAMKTAKETFGVSDSIVSFVLPLGTTINMDGTAIYQGVSAVFIAQAYGIPLTLGQQATILLTAVLASVGTAGVPGSGFVMLMMVLQSVGLPLEGVALIAGIDRVLDMGRTAVNVTGNVSACIVVGASEHELDRDAATIINHKDKSAKA